MVAWHPEKNAETGGAEAEVELCLSLTHMGTYCNCAALGLKGGLLQFQTLKSLCGVVKLS
jgi:hypothetical protein